MKWKRALELDKSLIPVVGYKENRKGKGNAKKKHIYTGNVILTSLLTYKEKEEKRRKKKRRRRRGGHTAMNHSAAAKNFDINKDKL